MFASPLCRPPRLNAAVALISLALPAALTSGATRFVDPSSPGPTHNGTSWAFAYTSLSTALAAASSGDEIWIANGIYKPTTTTDRTASFFIPNGVKLFGGFGGAGVNETLISQRDFALNRSILSGNIGGAGDADNSYHVVRFDAAVGGTTVLDGLYITEGQADGGGSDNQGAGMRNAGAPNIRNCVFVGNVAASSGGALLCLGDAGLTNCVFSGNTATTGPAVDMQGAHINLNNCTIVNNTSTTIGGAAVRLLNGDGFNTLIRNCILRSNTATSGTTQAQQIAIASVTLQIDHSCVEGLDGSLGGSGNTGAQPRFFDPNGLDNVFGTVDDNPSLRAGSVGIDAGANAAIPTDVNDIDDDGNSTEPLPFDMAGKARFVEDIVNNTGIGTGSIVDMGAYEFKQPVRVICVNDTATGGGFGHTWADAHTTLQAALLDAGDVKDPGPEVIYVAQGTYKPSSPAGRAATFNMIAGVRIYGGFDDSGTQGSLSQRRPDEFQAILSGDIGTPNNASDNCFHVVTANGANFFGAVRPTLDGFVITRGNANGTVANGVGAGLIATNPSAADPIIRNCHFAGNISTGIGGVAVNSFETDISIINCVFSGSSNPDNSMPAVLFNGPGTPSLINCTVAHNTKGVGVGDLATLLTMTNCIVVNNGGGSELSQLVIVGTPNVNRCCIQSLGGGLGGTGNISALPSFIDADGPDNIIGTPDDDYHVLSCSSVIDAGDAGALPADSENLDDDLSITESFPIDKSGLLRALNDLDVPNAGIGANPPDMGAYEFQTRSVGTCPADCAPVGGDGQVNVSDLLQVITSWGVGSPAGDVSPPCGDGLVNVTDLLAVITAWGACP